MSPFPIRETDVFTLLVLEELQLQAEAPHVARAEARS